MTSRRTRKLWLREGGGDDCQHSPRLGQECHLLTPLADHFQTSHPPVPAQSLEVADPEVIGLGSQAMEGICPTTCVQGSPQTVRVHGIPVNNTLRELEDQMGTLILPLDEYADPLGMCAPGGHVPILLRTSKSLTEFVALVIQIFPEERPLFI